MKKGRGEEKKGREKAESACSTLITETLLWGDLPLAQYITAACAHSRAHLQEHTHTQGRGRDVHTTYNSLESIVWLYLM